MSVPFLNRNVILFFTMKLFFLTMKFISTMKLIFFEKNFIVIFGFFIPAFLQSRKVRKAVTHTHNEIVLLRRKSEKPYDTRVFAKGKSTIVAIPMVS